MAAAGEAARAARRMFLTGMVEGCPLGELGDVGRKEEKKERRKEGERRPEEDVAVSRCKCKNGTCRKRQGSVQVALALWLVLTPTSPWDQPITPVRRLALD